MNHGVTQTDDPGRFASTEVRIAAQGALSLQKGPRHAPNTGPDRRYGVGRVTWREGWRCLSGDAWGSLGDVMLIDTLIIEQTDDASRPVEAQGPDLGRPGVEAMERLVAQRRTPVPEATGDAGSFGP